ncbi:MspA family porin [Nocardia crassostreae]|uniref:MspA family porin n=1 Tax=Nocardia crassostreae TaxID=53428 RepID=UPI000833E35B|nr:MspA family porin [Nocardia crassostreae]
MRLFRRFRPLSIALLSIGASLSFLPQGHAEVITLPAHEQTYQSTFGSFTVGHGVEFINRIAPLNQMGTTREAFISTAAYGRINGMAGGTLKVGYHVGCAVTIGAGTVGATPDLTLLVGPQPNLAINPNPVATLNLNAGEVKEVPLAEKEVAPGITATTVIRDFHIVVNQCTGPVTIRQYAYLYAKSAEIDDSGAVFGHPTWL